jgi:NodT family efflux transporter outer membrane factor (OMF) lipoprotein
MKSISRALMLALGAAAMTACAVGPDYHRPPFDAAANYKESTDWKPSEPNDALTRGPWWKIYNDEALNRLEDQVNISNENIKAAAAAFEESRALVAQARAGFWPTLAGTFGRTRIGEPGFPARNEWSAGASANWDLDIWGGIRRTVESDRASAQASSAALASARLSAQADLATDYFELRAQDQNQKLLDDTVDAETQSLKITESRYKFGVAARADVVSAQAQLLSSQAQQVNAKIQRAVLEHAIAVLTGQQPAVFSVAVSAIRTDVPTVPAGVPSTLLERRPDVAQAERRMAAANAQIGVAKAAYFPSLTLAGQTSYSNSSLSHLFQAATHTWSLGPQLAETLFDGGLRRAQVAQARAAYEASVDTYRQTVLTSFEQVEDDIVTLRVLEQQSGIEDAAVKAAREAEALTLNQYKAGTVPYSSVITAQTTRFAAEETALAVLSSRLQASVGLIEALGGGWDQSMATAN